MMKHFVFVAATMLCTTFAWGQRVYQAKDFGIVPNTGKDMTQAFANALSKIKTEADDKAAVLRLEAGDYDFFYDKANVRELYVSNHDQDNPKHVAIIIEDMENFTLDGGGASIHMNGRMLPIAMLDCNDCTIKNLSIDTRIPQITQVKVLENDVEQGTITYEVAPYARYTIENGRFTVHGENWKLQPSWGIAFEGDTKHGFG